MSAASREGLRERRKRVTRAELLLAGRRLFSEKGLYLSRVEDLASQAGIAKGTLYQYFRNKEDLIQAVVQAGFEELDKWVEERVAGARDPDELLLRIAQAHIDFLTANTDLLRIFHQVRGLLKFEGKEWRPLRAVLQRHLDCLAGRMRAGRPSISNDPAVRRELAELLFGAVSGSLSVRASMNPGAPLAPAPPALTLALASMARSFVLERSRARLSGWLGTDGLQRPRREAGKR